MKKLTKKNAIIIGAISLVLVAAILCIILIPNCNGNPPDENTEDKPIIIVEATDKTFLSAGTTQYVVVRPSEPTNYEEYAVEELVKYFAEATGVTLPVKSDSSYTFDENATVISVGNTTIFEGSGITLDKYLLGDEGYRIETKGKAIIMNGCAGYGTLFSVYEFLSHTVGFEAYAPDEIVVNNTNNIPLYNFSITDYPSVRNAAGGWYVASSDARFAAKWRVLAGTGTSIFDGSIWGTWAHAIYSYIEPAIYHESHPEYFAHSIDKNGNIVPTLTGAGEPTQICFSSIEGGAADIVVESMKQKILDMPDKKFFMIGQNDTGGFCKCKTCSENEEKYKSPSGSMMIFTNYVARKIKEWQTDEGIDRDIFVSSFAYNATEPAPVIKDDKGNDNPNDDTYSPVDEKIIAEDNVMIMIAPASADYSKDLMDPEYNQFYADVLKGWSSICDHFAVWAYGNYFFQQFEFYDNWDAISQNIKNWHDIGAMFYFNENGGAKASQAFQIMSGYVNSKLSWNPDRNVDDLIDNFITNYYKEAAPYVSDYFYSLRAYFKERKEWALTHDPFNAYIPTLMWTPQKGEKSPYVKEFWKKSFLDQMNDLLYEGIQAIKDAGHSEADELLYTERVLLETFTVRYELLKYFKSDYSTSEYARLVDQFEEDVLYFSITSDGYADMSETIAKWRE